MTTVAEAHGLTAEQLDALELELERLRAEVAAQLGAEDVAYIRRLIRIQRWSEVGGRASLFLGFLPPSGWPAWPALSLSKILDNMEIGHNVLHGQYDWTNDPALSSTDLRMGLVVPGQGMAALPQLPHHTFTNITEKDRDLGYGVIRISGSRPGRRPTWATPSTRSGWP
jgi:fatty acid desaturase